MYSFITKILFKLDPEISHTLALKSLKLLYQLNLTKFFFKSHLNNPYHFMNLTFPNRIGLAAGLDKNGEYIDALASLGFGFIEVGTVTPKPQIGNPKPRLFRLIKENAIINRMGFNNHGLEAMVKRLKKIKYRGILGINIGKNKDTPNENAIDDYLVCFKTLWPYASYITINISSPNTQSLRELQQIELLQPLLRALKEEQQDIFRLNQKYIPLVVKISPDLTDREISQMAEIFMIEKIDGVIATNTTLSRNGLNHLHAKQSGGLSGEPLNDLSTQIIKKFRKHLQNTIPMIASGGIMDKQAANDKWEAGADLLQVYTGFIYHGPSILKIADETVDEYPITKLRNS